MGAELATFASQLHGFGHQFEGVRRLRCALAAGPALREERLWASLYEPMPQEPEPDEPYPPVCANCYGVGSCYLGCPEDAPPESQRDTWTGDEDR